MKFFASGLGMRPARLPIAVLGALQDGAHAFQALFAVVRVKPERADERIRCGSDLAHRDLRIFFPQAARLGERRISD
jgi:hypothetical protein